MNAPIPIHSRLLGTRARAQNATARHICNPLNRWGSFLLADAVGTGKSYIALSLAFGLFRRRERRPFRVLVLAGPTELSDSWIQKLAGKAGTAPTIGHLARGAGHESFLDLYWPRRNKPDFTVYQIRSHRDVRALADHFNHSDDVPEVLRTGGSGPYGRIEVLISSPKYILNLRRNGLERFWRQWVANSDFVIADEVFSAKNHWTTYGRLLRDLRFDVWPLSRPPLLGLSATLLSRDLPDAESVLQMAIDWGRKTGARATLESRLKEQLGAFRTSLRLGLRNPTKEAVHAYTKTTRDLERSLRVLLVRAQPKRQRSITFWSGGHSRLLGDSGVNIQAFPTADVIKDIVRPLRETASVSPKAAEGLSWFLMRNPYKVDGSVSSSDYHCWTAVTESPSPLEKNAANHPKLSSLREWIKQHYDEAERSWLKCGKGEFRFKLLVYVHHVKTAGKLSPRSVRSFGRTLQREVETKIRGTCVKLAKDLPDLFVAGDFGRPTPTLTATLARTGWSIEQLRRKNSTLFLAALLNARKGRLRPIVSFKRTLSGGQKRQLLAHGALLLQRSAVLRAKFFEAEGRILAFDRDRTAKSKSLTAALLDPKLIRVELRAALSSALALSKQEFGQLVFKKPDGKSHKRLEELALAARAVFDEDRRWRSLARRANRAPRKILRRLVRQSAARDGIHREPATIAVLTGGDSDNRNFVTRRFCEPGNPFVLILTHVCQIGIDLHPFCWDILHYSPAWTPHEAEQKTGRIDRPRLPSTIRQLDIGVRQSRQAIRLHHLVWPFTYDERILSRLNIRAQYAERLLGSKDAHDSADERARALSLFKPLSLDAR
jgi:hypothetical protein